jgi:hypothetical protein
MAQPGHLPTSANNALPGASAAVPAVPVLTKQQAEHQAEHQAVNMRMVAEHRRRQEEDLLQMVFRLNAAVQHQGGQVVSSEDAGAQRQGGQVVSADVLDTQEPGSQQLATGQPAASTAASAPVPGMRSGVRVVHPPGATLLQMNAARNVASIFTAMFSETVLRSVRRTFKHSQQTPYRRSWDLHLLQGPPLTPST